MPYQVNLRTWTEVDGQKVKLVNEVNIVADDKPPEQVVYEKLLDLSDDTLRLQLIALGWTPPP